MKTKAPSRGFSQPSLVPLADMLTNTVGIVLFILIFTVLAASGAVIPKRFPMEMDTKKKALFYMILDNRVYSSELGGLREKFMTAIPKLRSFDGIEKFMKKFNSYALFDDYFTVRGEGEEAYEETSRSIRFTPTLNIRFEPLEGVGEGIADITSGNNRFVASLKSKDPKKYYVAFLVDANSIETFQAAREAARAIDFQTGWGTWDKDITLQMNITGGDGEGRIIKPD